MAPVAFTVDVAGGVVGGCVVGGAVVGGCVVGDFDGVGVGVGVGDFDGVGVGVGVGVGDFDGDGDFVGDFVAVGDFEAVTDFDEAGVGGGITILAGLPPTKLLAGCAGALVCATALGRAGCDWVWVGSVMLGPGPSDGPLLLEISTATIATTPMAAAPIPANKKVRDPGDPVPPGGGSSR